LQVKKLFEEWAMAIIRQGPRALGVGAVRPFPTELLRGDTKEEAPRRPRGRPKADPERDRKAYEMVEMVLWYMNPNNPDGAKVRKSAAAFPWGRGGVKKACELLEFTARKDRVAAQKLGPWQSDHSTRRGRAASFASLLEDGHRRHKKRSRLSDLFKDAPKP
jgi:hypothetical protein